MSAWKICAVKALENIAIAVCVSYAAVSMDKWKLLWFLLIIPFNAVSVTTKYKEDGDA